MGRFHISFFWLIYCHKCCPQNYRQNEMIIVVWVHLPNPWWIHGWPGRMHQFISLFSHSDSIMLCFCNFCFSIGGLATESPSESQYATETCVNFINIQKLRRFKNYLMLFCHLSYSSRKKKKKSKKKKEICLTFLITISSRSLAILISDHTITFPHNDFKIIGKICHFAVVLLDLWASLNTMKAMRQNWQLANQDWLYLSPLRLLPSHYRHDRHERWGFLLLFYHFLSSSFQRSHCNWVL